MSSEKKRVSYEEREIRSAAAPAAARPRFTGAVAILGFDETTGTFSTINVQDFVRLLGASERHWVQTQSPIDSDPSFSVVVPSGASAGQSVDSGEQVPSGRVWYVSVVSITVPPTNTVSGNLNVNGAALLKTPLNAGTSTVAVTQSYNLATFYNGGLPYRVFSLHGIGLAVASVPSAQTITFTARYYQTPSLLPTL
jgi:hypothetical protein